MPELRLVVLALARSLAYGPTFVSAMGFLSGFIDERAAVPAESVRRAPASAASPQPARISTRSSRKPPKTLLDYQR